MGRPRTRWKDYIENIEGNRLELCLSKIMKVVEDRDVQAIQC